MKMTALTALLDYEVHQQFIFILLYIQIRFE